MRPPKQQEQRMNETNLKNIDLHCRVKYLWDYVEWVIEGRQINEPE